MAGRVIHADETPVPVLAPSAGRTKTGRQWVYLRDERPHARFGTLHLSSATKRRISSHRESRIAG